MQMSINTWYIGKYISLCPSRLRFNNLPNNDRKCTHVDKHLQTIGDRRASMQRKSCTITQSDVNSSHLLSDLLFSEAQCAAQHTILQTSIVVVVVPPYVLTQHLNKVIDCLLICWKVLKLPDQP